MAEGLRSLLALAAAAGLTACASGGSGAGAPIDYRTGGPAVAAPARPAPAPARPPAPAYSPAADPSAVSSMPAVQEAAALAPQRGARPGGPLRQPPDNPAARTLTVQPGDSLYRISSQYAVNVRALVEVNGLQPPYTLRPGQSILLPPPNVHAVQEGETLYSIARRFSVDTRSLAVMNGLSRPWVVWPGDELKLPPLARDQWGSPAAATAPATAVAAPAGQPVAAPEAYAENPARPVEFIWPVTGPVLKGYGPAADGSRNDGVNIAAAPGDFILASADGEVVYAGDEVAGLGRLLLIQHAGGWVSAYALAETLLVEEAEQVRQGQPVARVGKQGPAGPPEVHFELRRGAQPVDPAGRLPELAR